MTLNESIDDDDDELIYMVNSMVEWVRASALSLSEWLVPSSNSGKGINIRKRNIIGSRKGTRTQSHRIRSHLLYHLSYHASVSPVLLILNNVFTVLKINYYSIIFNCKNINKSFDQSWNLPKPFFFPNSAQLVWLA